MKLFLDSADPDEIKELARWRVIDGVTTTPTFFRRLGEHSTAIRVRALSPLEAHSLDPVAGRTTGDDGPALTHVRVFSRRPPPVLPQVTPRRLVEPTATEEWVADG